MLSIVSITVKNHPKIADMGLAKKLSAMGVCDVIVDTDPERLNEELSKATT